MAAVIGALRVDLGLNSAEFQAGLKKAQAGLGSFVKVAGVGLAAVATAAIAAGAALGVAVKGAIDNADEMGEMAQKVGVSVEALSSLSYAAKMSGTDTETLSTSLRKLSANMLAVAQGSTGPVATAFQALGVSVQNADGTLRASDAVLLDVAEKFALMEDGATKTALAIQLFGRSGSELVPFLSQGREGLAALTAEADRLGITISTNTANAAGEFNDTLDRLQGTFDGVINKVMEGALPALNEFGDKLADPSFAANAQAIGGAIVQAMSAAVDAINTAAGAMGALQRSMEWARTHDMFGNEMAPSQWDQMKAGIDAKRSVTSQLNAGNTSTDVDSLYRGIFGASTEEIKAASQEVAEAFVPVINNTKAASSAASSLKSVMAEGQAVFTATRTPAEAYALEVERLNGLLQKGAIDQDTYARAVKAAKVELDKADVSASSLSSTIANDIGSAIGGLINGTKDLGSAIGELAGQLAQVFLKQGASMFGGMGGGLGFLGDLLGGLFGGFRASGGPISAGKGYIVGERGPEMIIPRSSGMVVPNDALRGGGGEIAVRATMQVVDGNLVPVITQVSGQVAGQQIKAYDRQLPNRVQDIQERQG